mgnify:CR=1 FL=1
MEIPELNVNITKAAVNGQVYDVVDYEDFCNNHNMYLDRSDVAIPVNFKDNEILLPYRGEYPKSGKTPITPGVYNAGVVDFVVDPDEAFISRYTPKNVITLSNSDNIKDLIKAGEEARKLDEAFITTPDSITNIPVKDNDSPEMKCLKMALNAKHIDLDKYAGRFGNNYPNDKRQLKNNTATLNIIKRYCENMDMEAILILRDKNPEVPNPMGREIAVSLIEDENNIMEEPMIYDGPDVVIYEDDDTSLDEK